MTTIFRFTALLLIPLLVRAPSGAQNAASLRIRALSESVDQNTLAVEVSDAQGAAVPDVGVTFRLPEDGITGTFADGARVAVEKTDPSGHAHVTGIRWMATGTASVRITATKGSAHAGILLECQAALAVPAASKQIAAVQSPAPQPKPPLSSVAATKPPDQKVIAEKTGPQKAVVQTAVAVPPSSVKSAPTIEPPHVSITSVSRKQSDQAHNSAGSPNAVAEPSVAITGAGQHHGGSKKWIILAVVAAGAAGGAAVMLSRGKSAAATTTSSSGVSIGAPTISIGAP